MILARTYSDVAMQKHRKHAVLGTPRYHYIDHPDESDENDVNKTLARGVERCRAALPIAPMLRCNTPGVKFEQSAATFGSCRIGG